MTKAIFLDRDGTINIDYGYIGNPNLVKLFDGVGEGIKKLKDELKFQVIVVSNQSGITRGLIKAEDVENVNKKINEILESYNTRIDAFYYCPFHPDFDSQEDIICRKPSPNMILQAAKDFNVDLKKSFMIGDRETDILCGINAGVKTVLLKNTISDEKINELKNSQNSPNFIACNFLDAVSYIDNNILGEFVES